MSLFECSNCNCIENTAVSNWIGRYLSFSNKFKREPKSREEVDKYFPPLCSFCDPSIGRWHNRFEKLLVCETDLMEGEDGFLYSKKSFEKKIVKHTKLKKMDVIFLDIDGVLTQDNSSCIFNPRNVNIFNKMLSALPEVKIVISSTRRIGKPLVYFRELFAANRVILSRLIGMTPFSAEENPSGLITKVWGRGTEIQKYIERDPRVKRYVIIDDQDMDLKNFGEKFFKTEFKDGLTEKLAEAVVQYFKKK